MKRTRVAIAGAAGRDFHDFSMVYRRDAAAEVVAFTAAQIPGIERRRYPPSLAGPLYPQGIPIVPEAELESLKPDRVVFASSDVTDAEVVVSATPIDIARLLHPAKPVVRARYEFEDASAPGLEAEIDAFVVGLVAV
jgi:predicted GTPase